jgi:putative SOS response-associated peptidase YedK
MKLRRVRRFHSIIRVPCNQNSLESAARFAAIRAAIQCCAVTRVAVIIRNEDRNEEGDALGFWFRRGAPDRLIGECMINARAETLLERPSFKRLVAMRRRLVPADGFYE